MNNDLAEGGNRVHRLIWLIQEIRNDPCQELTDLLKRAGISKSQFYKDRSVLADIGFSFQYKTKEGFRIVEDRLATGLHITLSDRLLIMFALKHLSSTGEGHLAAHALSAGRKLVGGLTEPFKTELTEAFNNTVIKDGYGCSAEVLDEIEESVKEKKRIRIHYRSENSKQTKWREIEPRRIYFLQRALYLFAKVVGESEFKAFKISRISEIEPTGISYLEYPDNDNFFERLSNAFIHFMGDKAHEVVLRFRGGAIPFVKETLWHKSQEIEEKSDGSILFKVQVAEPREVFWWALQYGENAEVLEPKWLRDEAIETTSKMAKVYEKQQLTDGDDK